MEEENKLEIELANNTIKWIGSLSDSEISRIRKNSVSYVLYNLVEFQDAFASPISLPFELGQDCPSKIQVHRPMNVLLKYMIIFETGQDKSDFVENGIGYCIIGSEIWKELVSKGKLQNLAFIPEKKPLRDWISDLFSLFEIALGFNFDRKVLVRRIAACWYHVATQIDFEASNGDEEPFNDAEFLSLTLNALTRAGEEEELNDEDVEEIEGEEKNVSSSLHEMIDDDGYNSEDDEDYNPGMEIPEKSEYVQSGIYEKLASPPVVSPQELAVREVVFKVIQGLGAYLPNPSEDIDWFKRVLRSIPLAQAGGTDWFPWGCPPLKPILENLSSNDMNLRNYSSQIIEMFQKHSDS